jgi:hypothetical protein
MQRNGKRGDSEFGERDTGSLSDRKMFLLEILAVRLDQTNAGQWAELPARVLDYDVKATSHALSVFFTSPAMQLIASFCATASRELHILHGALSHPRQLEAPKVTAMKRGIRG